MLTSSWSNPTNSKVTMDWLTKPINVIAGAYLSWETTNLACQFTNCFLDRGSVCHILCWQKCFNCTLYPCQDPYLPYLHPRLAGGKISSPFNSATKTLLMVGNKILSKFAGLSQCVRPSGRGKKKKKRNLKYLPPKPNILYYVLLRYSWIFAENGKSLPPFYLLPTCFMTFAVSTSNLADKIKFLFPAPCSFRPLLIKSLLGTMPWI